MHVYVFKIIRIKTILLNCIPDVLNEFISMHAKVQTLSATYGTLINLQPNQLIMKCIPIPLPLKSFL